MNKTTIARISKELDREIELERYDDDGHHKAKILSYNPSNQKYIIRKYDNGLVVYYCSVSDVVDVVNDYNSITLD